jgi:hypothetical protein
MIYYVYLCFMIILPSIRTNQKTLLEIYNIYYTDIDYNIFLKLINLDPNNRIYFNDRKMGKYGKWILREYRKGYFDAHIKNDCLNELKSLREELKLIGTSWLNKRMGYKLDILTYSYSELVNLLSVYLKEYELEKMDSDIKYDLVYEDEKWLVFVPLNYKTSLYMCGKDTQWCTHTKQGWQNAKQENKILFRFIPKGYDLKKMRLSMGAENSTWALPYSISTTHIYVNEDKPFDTNLINSDEALYHNIITKQISNLNDKIKSSVMKYYVSKNEINLYI